MHELLFEIGTEEIPAGYIQPALDALAANVARKLQDLGLAFTGVHTCGTPRRLTLVIDDLESRQPDRRQEHVGPSKKAGFDADGNLTRAAIGLRSRGPDRSSCGWCRPPRADTWWPSRDVQGKETAALLPEVLEALVRELVFPKSMRWADSSLAFARLVQWLLGVYAGGTIPLTIENIVCGNTTRGHRFLARRPSPWTASPPTGTAWPPVSSSSTRPRRRDRAWSRRCGRRWANTPGWPRPGRCCTRGCWTRSPTWWSSRSASVAASTKNSCSCPRRPWSPRCASAEILPGGRRGRPPAAAVRGGQQHPHRRPAPGRQRPRAGAARAARGRPVLLQRGPQTALADRCPELRGIVFQNQQVPWARAPASSPWPAPWPHASPRNWRRMSGGRRSLAKADLLTAMVGEFPSLQGIMGRVYAGYDGAEQGVARAIEEHYLPVRAGGDLPQSLDWRAGGRADRLDTLVGCFAIGEKPTGNKDAFGLRRQGHRPDQHHPRPQYPPFPAGKRPPRPWPATRAWSSRTRRPWPRCSPSSACGSRTNGWPAACCRNWWRPPPRWAATISSTPWRASTPWTASARGDFPVLAGSFKRIRNIVKDNRGDRGAGRTVQRGGRTGLFATSARCATGRYRWCRTAPTWRPCRDAHHEGAGGPVLRSGHGHGRRPGSAGAGSTAHRAGRGGAAGGGYLEDAWSATSDPPPATRRPAQKKAVPFWDSLFLCAAAAGWHDFVTSYGRPSTWPAQAWSSCDSPGRGRGPHLEGVQLVRHAGGGLVVAGFAFSIFWPST